MSHFYREEGMGGKDEDKGKTPINQAANRGVGGTRGRGSGQDRSWRRGGGPREGIGNEEVDDGEDGNTGHRRSRGGRGERSWRCVRKSATPWLLALLPLCLSTGFFPRFGRHRHSHRHLFPAEQQRGEHGEVLRHDLCEGRKFSASLPQWRWRGSNAGMTRPVIFRGLRLRGGCGAGGMTEGTWEQLNVANKRRRKKVPDAIPFFNKSHGKNGQWQKAAWRPTIPFPGFDEYQPLWDIQTHDMYKREGGPENETLEELVERCPCAPPYCGKCPLRSGGNLTASAMLVHERVTGEAVDVSSSIRRGSDLSFSTDATWDMGTYTPCLSIQQNLDHMLRRASENGEVMRAKALIEAGANVSCVDNYGLTPLHEASEDGNAEMIRLLTSKGANVSSLDVYGRVPLHWAALMGHFDACQALLEVDGGRLVHALSTDKEGDCPAFLALFAGHDRLYHYLNIATIHGRGEARRFLNFSEPHAEMYAGGGDPPPWPGPVQTEEERLRELFELSEGCLRDVEMNDADGQKLELEIPWGEGTNFPEPWQCWFCNRTFGTFEKATDHEGPCGESRGWRCTDEGWEGLPGWSREGEAHVQPWVREYRELLECIYQREAMEEGRKAAGDPGIWVDTDGAEERDDGEEGAEGCGGGAEDIEDMGKIWSKVRRNLPGEQGGNYSGDYLPRHSISKSSRHAYNNLTMDDPDPLRRRIWKNHPLRMASHYNRFDFMNASRALGMPPGYTNKYHLAQLPSYLHKTEDYLKWMEGEEVLPPEMRKTAKKGRILLSDLESKDRDRLAQGMFGGPSRGQNNLTATGSVMRRTMIEGMSKEQCLDELVMHGVDISDITRRQAASIRLTLIETEVELGLMLEPMSWGANKKRRRKPIQVHQAALDLMPAAIEAGDGHRDAASEGGEGVGGEEEGGGGGDDDMEIEEEGGGDGGVGDSGGSVDYGEDEDEEDVEGESEGDLMGDGDA